MTPIEQAIEPWEDRVKPDFPNTDPRTWKVGVSLGFVESHMKDEIDELRAALSALRGVAPVGEPPKRLSDDEINAIYDETPSAKVGPFILRFARAIESEVLRRVGGGV